MEPFKPPFGLKNPHLLTIISSFLPRGKEILAASPEAQLVRVSADSQISVYCHLQPDFIDKPTLILVHGLEGSANSFYITSLTQAAFAARSNVIRVNLRSCGKSLDLTPTLYHAGQSQDLLKLLDFLKTHKKLNNFFLVGFSLGGNMVLKAAAELNNQPFHLNGACAIAPSIDLACCVDALDQSLNRLYSKHFVKRLKRKVILKQKLIPKRYDLSYLPYIKNIRQFDDIYTARDGGFENADHYYREASALSRLKDIHVPTQIIAAKDDPFIPYKQFEAVETDFIRLISTEYGGHVGFISSIHLFGHQEKISFRWLESQILRFVLKNTRSYEV